jgi:predicted alpha/beta hydrolase
MTHVSPQPYPITTDDGVPLAGKRFEPVGRARGNVLIHGATATPQRYYAAFATELAGRGFRVITYDYRGIGDSRHGSLRKLDTSMTEWARRDAAAAHDAVAAFSEPLLVVGHSFGGQLLGLIDPPARARAIVLVGSQLPYIGHWPTLSSIGYGALWHGVVPATVATFGYLPGFMGLGVDLPGGVALEWAKWCTSPGYLRDHHPDAAARFARVTAPVLVYSFTDDEYGPKRAIDALVGALSGARLVHRRFAPSSLGRRDVGHFGFFRRDVVRPLWEETIHFFESALAGADPGLRSRSPSTWSLEPTDVEADLAYGRA